MTEVDEMERWAIELMKRVHSLPLHIQKEQVYLDMMDFLDTFDPYDATQFQRNMNTLKIIDDNIQEDEKIVFKGSKIVRDGNFLVRRTKAGHEIPLAYSPPVDK